MFDLRTHKVRLGPLGVFFSHDTDTLQAVIHVHGSNGIQYTACGGTSTHQTPPSVLSLSNKDTFMIRKKVFRFEYGVEDSPELAEHSPAAPGTPTKVASPAPVRRRASHRLSLVPAGKDFMPHSPANSRRHSKIVMGSGGTDEDTEMVGRGDEDAITKIEEEQEEEEEEELVDVVEGEEGDRVYLEVKEDIRVSSLMPET